MAALTPRPAPATEFRPIRLLPDLASASRAMPDDGQAMTKPCPMTHRAPLRVVRAAVFAVVGTVLGVSAHHLVAEGPVPWRQSVGAAAALFAVGFLGAQRPRSLSSVVATCGAAQTGLHLWLMRQHPDPPQADASMAVPGHMHHGMDTHGAWHGRLHDSLPMTAVHALAAVLVAVLLHRADAACWALARGVTTAVDAVRRHIAAARTLLTRRPARVEAALPPLLSTWLGRPPLKGAVLADVIARRGPPRAGLIHVNRP